MAKKTRRLPYRDLEIPGSPEDAIPFIDVTPEMMEAVGYVHVRRHDRRSRSVADAVRRV
jgi:hypothetical protein